MDSNIPNTSKIDELTAQLTQSRQKLGQRVADIPATYAQYAPESDQTIAGLRANQADKIRQLFEHDSQLAPVYFSPQAAPGPSTGNVPVEPQRLVDPTIGQRAAGIQQTSTANELADIITQINTRKDTLSTERDKALTMLSAVIKAGENEQSSLEKQLQLYIDERDKKTANALAILKLTGGAISPELAQQLGDPSLAGKVIPGPGATSGADATTDLFNAIFGFQQKGEAVKPQTQITTTANPFNLLSIDGKPGFAKRNRETGLLEPLKKAGSNYRALINELNKYQGAEFDWQKNPDGTFIGSVRKPDQQFLQPSEVPAYSDPTGTINKLAAVAIATDPKMKSAIESILKLLSPEKKSDLYLPSSKRTVDFEAKRVEAQAKINALRAIMTPEETVQERIRKIIERDPDLKGYIK